MGYSWRRGQGRGRKRGEGAGGGPRWMQGSGGGGPGAGRGRWGGGMGRGRGWGRGGGWGGPPMGPAPMAGVSPLPPPPEGVLRVAAPVMDASGLNSVIAPMFARAPFIVFADIVNGVIANVHVQPNPASMQGGGAGMVVGQMIVSSGARIVLAANVGPNLQQVLGASGVEVRIVSPGVRFIDALKQHGLVRG